MLPIFRETLNFIIILYQIRETNPMNWFLKNGHLLAMCNNYV